ncbi:MAG TPA: hypothetical protein VFZ81_16940 [Burkholderiales bacterium]
MLQIFRAHCVLLLLATSASAGSWAAPALVFAGAGEAGGILGGDDEYVRATRPLERMAKLRRAQPVDAGEYRRHMAAQARDWTEDERRRLAPLNARLARFLDTLKLRMPERILLVKAGTQLMDGAPHTRANAIVLPESFLASAQPEDLVYIMGHELFHVLSRHDGQAREELYAAIGFRRCERADLPETVERLRITNPDAPQDRHTIRVRYRGQPVEAMPVLLLRSAQPDPARGFIGNSRSPWLIMERRDGACRGTAQRAQAGELEGLLEQIGRNTEYLIHPEEILADNFAVLVVAFVGGTSGPPASPEVLERMRRILFLPRE